MEKFENLGAYKLSEEEMSNVKGGVSMWLAVTWIDDIVGAATDLADRFSESSGPPSYNG